MQLYSPEKSLKDYFLIAQTNVTLLRMQIKDDECLYTIRRNS
jgi:hypothetical protein